MQVQRTGPEGTTGSRRKGRQWAHAPTQRNEARGLGAVAMFPAPLWSPFRVRDHLFCVELSYVKSVTKSHAYRVQKWNRFGEISSNGAYTFGISKVEDSKHEV